MVLGWLGLMDPVARVYHVKQGEKEYAAIVGEKAVAGIHPGVGASKSAYYVGVSDEREWPRVPPILWPNKWSTHAKLVEDAKSNPQWLSQLSNSAKVCAACNKSNSVTNLNCNACGRPLGDTIKQTANVLMDMVHGVMSVPISKRYGRRAPFGGAARPRGPTLPVLR